MGTARTGCTSWHRYRRFRSRLLALGSYSCVCAFERATSFILYFISCSRRMISARCVAALLRMYPVSTGGPFRSTILQFADGQESRVARSNLKTGMSWALNVIAQLIVLNWLCFNIIQFYHARPTLETVFAWQLNLSFLHLTPENLKPTKCLTWKGT